MGHCANPLRHKDRTTRIIINNNNNCLPHLSSFRFVPLSSGGVTVSASEPGPGVKLITAGEYPPVRPSTMYLQNPLCQLAASRSHIFLFYPQNCTPLTVIPFSVPLFFSRPSSLFFTAASANSFFLGAGELFQRVSTFSILRCKIRTGNRLKPAICSIYSLSLSTFLSSFPASVFFFFIDFTFFVCSFVCLFFPSPNRQLMSHLFAVFYQTLFAWQITFLRGQSCTYFRIILEKEKEMKQV